MKSTRTWLTMISCISIIGLITAIVMVDTGTHYRNRIRDTRAVFSRLASAIEAYQVDTGELPETLEQIRPKETHFGSPRPKWSTLTIDSWGNAIRYEKTNDTFVLTSAGPDGALGTPDDMWK